MSYRDAVIFIIFTEVSKLKTGQGGIERYLHSPYP